jgi:peptidoglycan/LPS O-acetylase OafA/YrhL/lysophospholipase L1-like esterase
MLTFLCGRWIVNGGPFGRLREVDAVNVKSAGSGTATSAEDDRSLAYQPALDGVRAVAVAMVLVFHAGFDWMRAGYLGVSIFFTLSGFLITSLLLKELSQRRTIDLGRFFSRRLRRLLPPSLICLGLVTLARSLGAYGDVPGMRGQLVGAVTNVFNWVQISGASTYSDLFAGTPSLVSPLEHYWSLAIEEQFYLLWPVILLLVGRRVVLRRESSRALVFLIVGTFVALAAAAPVLSASFGDDFAYWSTPTRLPELMAGAALAALVRRWPTPVWAGWFVGPALGALILLAVLLPTGAGPAYVGWMAPIAMLSAALLWGLQVPGWWRRRLSASPVVGLGKISYGVYLYHWPVFVLLRQRGWDLTDIPGLSVAVGVTLGLSVVSYRLIELPIRRTQWRPRLTIPIGLLATTSAVAMLVAMPISRGFLEADTGTLVTAAAPQVELLEPLVPTASPNTRPNVPPPRIDESRTSTTLAAAPSTSAPKSSQQAMATDIELAAAPSRPVRIFTIGDSTAHRLGSGLATWAVAHPAHASSDVLWCAGCMFMVDGTITSWDAAGMTKDSRRVLDEEIGVRLRSVQPDVVMLMTTMSDVADRQWTVDEGSLTPFDAVFVARLTSAYRDLTASLQAADAPRIVWVLPPTPLDPLGPIAQLERKRWDILHEVIRAVAHDAGPFVTVADAHGWGEQTGLSSDTDWRPDGVHLSESANADMIERWLGPMLIDAALSVPGPSDET